MPGACADADYIKSPGRGGRAFKARLPREKKGVEALYKKRMPDPLLQVLKLDRGVR